MQLDVKIDGTHENERTTEAWRMTSGRGRKSIQEFEFMNSVVIPVIDIFCGCGGFSWGAHMAGRPVILAVDCWQKALTVHELHHPEPGCRHVCMVLGDDSSFQQLRDAIRDRVHGYYEGGPMGPFHLHGSPPCQKASAANTLTRNVKSAMKLVDWFLALVRAVQPSSWSMEEVVGIAGELNPRRIPYVRLNALNFGVAQDRRRVFAGHGWNRTAVENIRIPAPSWSAALELEGISIAAEGINAVRAPWNGYRVDRVAASGKRIRIQAHRLRLASAPSFCILCKPPMLVRVHDVTACADALQRGFVAGEFTVERDMTCAEAATLQGFPASYMDRCPATVSIGDRHRMIGNAVCPPIARSVLRHVLPIDRVSMSDEDDDDDEADAHTGESTEDEDESSSKDDADSDSAMLGTGGSPTESVETKEDETTSSDDDDDGERAKFKLVRSGQRQREKRQLAEDRDARVFASLVAPADQAAAESLDSVATADLRPLQVEQKSLSWMLPACANAARRAAELQHLQTVGDLDRLNKFAAATALMDDVWFSRTVTTRHVTSYLSVGIECVLVPRFVQLSHQERDGVLCRVTMTDVIHLVSTVAAYRRRVHESGRDDLLVLRVQ
jgi:site-specific DNA-cytosine methylase